MHLTLLCFTLSNARQFYIVRWGGGGGGGGGGESRTVRIKTSNWTGSNSNFKSMSKYMMEYRTLKCQSIRFANITIKLPIDRTQ